MDRANGQLGATVLVGAIIASIVAIAVGLATRRSPRNQLLRPRRALTVRINEIPTNISHDDLACYIQSIVDQDLNMREDAVTVTHHHLTRRDHRTMCATATFHTSLPTDQLLQKLDQASMYRFDAHFRGITPLYEPSRSADVDLIAVHGLGSHAIGSWKSPRSDDVWLRDYLPDDLPNIRIILYGHDTSLQGSDSKDSIEDLGSRLLESINAFRGSDTGRRPVIFIGHSLGGLIVKEALVHASRRPSDGRNMDFCKACFGLLLFGVPNLGLRNEQLNSIVQGQPNEGLIRDLVTDDDSEPSSFLKRISDEFSHCCKGQYKVVSFFERRLSPTVKIQLDGSLTRTGPKTFMVTHKSATSTGLTAVADEINISLDTDHTGLVKYESRTQDVYNIVKERLNRLVDEAKQEVPKRFVENQPPKPTQRLIRDCLQSLAFLEMDDRPHDINEAARGTCEWLFSHKIYQTWKSSDRGLLWIKGKPGSGKSTLLKYALDKAQAARDVRLLFLAFFFHGRGNILQRTPLGLFRTLLHQLMRQVPDALPELIGTFDQKIKNIGNPGEKWEWHPNEVQRIFTTSLPNVLEVRSVYLFVDALDECNKKGAISLIQEFKSLVQLPPTKFPLRIFFTCRHYPILEYDCGLEICLEHENAQDIRTYVESRLSKIPRLMESKISFTIANRAEGVFIWALLVADRVREFSAEGKTLKEIEREVDCVPPQLNTLYRGLVQDMTERAASLKLIQWICFAIRPLSLDELRWAMVVDADGRHKSIEQCESTVDYVRSNAVMERRLKALSSGLAEVVQSTTGKIVQFIHQSVKDFFVEVGIPALNISDGDRAPPVNIPVSSAHYRLSRICIRYLAMEEIGQAKTADREQLMLKFPLIEYATTSWILHTKQGQTERALQDDILDYFDWPSEALLTLWTDFYNTIGHGLVGCPPEGASMIHIAAQHHWIELLEAILRRENQDKINMNPRDKYGRTPLCIAAQAGSVDIAKLLLTMSNVEVDSRDYNGDTPLSLAAKAGSEAVVKVLLATGKAKIDSKNDCGYTPLWQAIRTPTQEIVKLLIDTNQAGLDLKYGRYDRSLLSLAAVAGNESVIKLLLATGYFEINAKDNSGNSPLSLAAWAGNAATVKALLEIDRVDVNSKDKRGWSPLLLAVRERHEYVVELILKHNQIDVDLKDIHGRTPLMWACWAGLTAMVKLLLATGQVEINAKDDDGWRPIILAIRGKHNGVVMQLLKTGLVDINLTDNHRRTPLWWAMEKQNEPAIRLLLSLD